MEMNHQEAASLFRKAADQDHPRGQVNLGRMYEIGGGVERDLMKAYYYYTLAAVVGEERGMKAKVALEVSRLIGRDQIIKARGLAQDYFNGKGKPDFAR